MKWCFFSPKPKYLRGNKIVTKRLYILLFFTFHYSSVSSSTVHQFFRYASGDFGQIANVSAALPKAVLLL